MFGCCDRQEFSALAVVDKQLAIGDAEIGGVKLYFSAPDENVHAGKCHQVVERFNYGSLLQPRQILLTGFVRLVRGDRALRRFDQLHPVANEIAGRERLARFDIGADAAALRMAKHDDVLHTQRLHREFQRGRYGAGGAVRRIRRHEIGDIARDEQFARCGVKNRFRRHAAVAAADHHDFRLLPALREFAIAVLLGGQTVTEKMAIAFNKAVGKWQRAAPLRDFAESWHDTRAKASLAFMHSTIRPRRSVLYMPGSNARAMEKAKTLAADALILDLEDAVAPDAKIAARKQVTDAVKAGGFGPCEVIIRINALDTVYGADDLAAVAAAKPDGVLVPKISSPEQLRVIGKFLTELDAPDSLAVWAMIETPLSILDIREIAAAVQEPVTRLKMFVLGTNDIARETRAALVPGRLPMLPALTSAIMAARAFGIEVLDGVYNNLDDAEGFQRECREARELGFDGKTLIHPKQIETCNAVFSPSAEEIAQAKKLVALFNQPENKGKGAIAHEGRMVERLHAEMASRVIALSDAIKSTGR